MTYFPFSLCVVMLMLTVHANSVIATDYCGDPDLCKAGVTHVVCGHNGKFNARCPKDASMLDFNSALKTQILKLHNTQRNLVAGGGESKYDPACRMATMQWDDELAYVASFNVKQCLMSHDKCRNTDSFWYSGQNLAWLPYFTLNSTYMLEYAMELWYAEKDNANMNYINTYPQGYSGPVIGHFTVMMAERNIRLGCAASTYSVPGQAHKIFLLACNYATNNMVGFPIYTSCSKPGSKCTSGMNPSFKNLCSASEYYDVNSFY